MRDNPLPTLTHPKKKQKLIELENSRINIAPINTKRTWGTGTCDYLLLMVPNSHFETVFTANNRIHVKAA